MAGENELLEAEGIDPNAKEVDIENAQNVVTNETVQDTTKTGNEALDKRLEELATGTNRGNEAAQNTQVDKTVKLSPEQIAANKAKEVQAQGNKTQQQQPSIGIGGFTGKAPKAYGPRFNWDARGNVIDKTTGGVIASVGAERKAFERMIPIINSATIEADKFKGMYEAAIKSNTVASSLNLTPEEFSIGARIMAQWKSDPKKALAFLVKEAQNNGVDMSDLGIAGGGGPSVQQIQTALEDIVKKHLEPFSFITTDREEAARQREALTEAQGVVEEFYASMPDAKIHEDSLAKIMMARSGTSLNEAYLILKNHALENKLDWTKDLVPQIQALVGKQPNSNGQPANGQRSLPNMNGRVNSEAIVPSRQGPLSGNASSKDIVKEAMRAAGMNVTDI